MGALQSLRRFIDEAEDTWSADDFEELAAYAREIEGRRTGVYVLSDDEREAIQEGIAQADRGEFATDEELAADRRRFGL